MAVKLLAINDVYNIREAKYIVDEENEKNLIPEEDKVQGTRVLVIKGSKEYRMDSNKNWVLIKGEGGGDTLPDVSSTDNGKVLGVVNGEWDKMSAPGGDDFFIINGTLDEEYDSQTDTYVPVFVPDKTADEVVAAMQAGKYLVATAYNANWNETYVMNCVKQQITDSVGGAYTASAYFIGEDNTKKAATQYLYKTQYYIKFEYQHPADGGGSEPEISWVYSDETFSVPSKGFYQADIRLSTENITPSTTYTVDASISQTQAISKIRTSSLSITLYYSNYSNNAKNYRATNYSIDGSTVYFDVIETISSSSPQITLHKFSWASNNTVTRLGSYTIPIPALPAVTASDNGKVLGVVDGVWNKITAPSGLPSVTSSDNGKVLGVSGGAWNKVSGLPSVGDNDNGKFLSVINNAWAKKDPPYRVDLETDTQGFIYESGSGSYAEANLSFLTLSYSFPDTITVEYDGVRYTLPRTSESTYEYPVYYGDNTYTYAPFYISITDADWHFLAPISEVGTSHTVSCSLADFAMATATDEFKAAVKACGATGYNVFSPLTVIAQSQSVTTTSDGTHNIGDIITTITVDAPPKYIQITSPGYIVYSYGIYSEEGYQGIYYDDSEHDFEILYDMNESSWKLITPLPGTYTVEISCEIKASVQPSEDFKEAAKNSFSIHNYTVIYDDGTTATLRNVEVV